MTYPPAPWHLQGKALISLHWVSTKTSRPLIPSELAIVPILPGQSLGGVYLATYQAGSVLEYNELIVVPALVRYQNCIGFWISHIYVDRDDSMRGGQEIWGLPKEIAEFTWTETEVEVTQANHSLCRFSIQSKCLDLTSWRLPTLEGKCLSRLNGDLLTFKGQVKSQVSIISGKLTIPQKSSFSSLDLERGFLSFALNKLDLTVNSPRQIRGFSIS